ncbi:hypothetical protein P171DRAFT_478361 [Karstenula rhodostoma CBS 690.94]|uniref:Zn(2)-C6 fungal-type domain-containing protein n=1 Tax=Karstenula rhodostoma CBS 690.94 TaxID=1392251 RepID=A0A9P4PYS0_9PLEO|nr:hypothetical protein P171DRAFT_478361 [Karstenula rhodostoma CBS 690.94]
MVRNHTQELLSGPRLRNACDRCHTQKLRCLKSQQGDACIRCSKFGSSCVYSARTARRIRKKDSANAPSNPISTTVVSPRTEGRMFEPCVFDSTILAQDWMDPSILLEEMPVEIPNCDLLGTGSFDGPSFVPSRHVNQATGNASNVLVSNATFDLADLNSKLVDHHANLASVLQVEPSSAFGPKIIAIDETFALTRRLIDMFKSFSIRSADHATVLLFFSCYYRLVDIYQGLFEKMEMCTRNPHAIVPKGITLNMPATQVGSYITTDLWKTMEATEAPMTTYSTHSMMLLLLCRSLCEELRDAIASGRTQAPGGNTALRWHVKRCCGHFNVYFTSTHQGTVRALALLSVRAQQVNPWTYFTANHIAPPYLSKKTLEAHTHTTHADTRIPTMGNKVVKPAHPHSFGPHPGCLMLPIGACWWCTFYQHPENKWADDCPEAPEGVQLSDSNEANFFIPAGHLEYQGTVYNIEPGICVDSGGTWIVVPSPGGCDIPRDAAINADLSTAVVDRIVARDTSPGLETAGNMEHEHFIENVGLLVALILCALFFAMWARDIVKSMMSKRRVQADWENLAHTSGMGFVGKDSKEKNNLVSEDCNKAI